MLIRSGQHFNCNSKNAVRIYLASEFYIYAVVQTQKESKKMNCECLRFRCTSPTDFSHVILPRQTHHLYYMYEIKDFQKNLTNQVI